MTERTVPIHRWLLPFSWIYGGGILQSKSFDVPVICIGNLTVGGTGKTPHTEYLIRLLQQVGLNVAVLSRGYKRKSKGYILADAHSNATQIGDEPYQMKEKFPQARIAVDADRRHGISQLLELDNPRPDVILLDDAFQHRYVQAGLNILLTDYNRLFTEDSLLPAGRLREPASGKTRAQIIIVTKCPQDIKPIDFNITLRQKPQTVLLLRPSRLQRERPEAHRKRIFTNGGMPTSHHHNRERRGTAQGPTSIERRPEALHLRHPHRSGNPIEPTRIL